MKRAVISALILSAGLVMSLPASAQDFASQFVGVWKLVDLTRTEVVSGKVDKPFGEKPTGYYIATKGGHFMWTNVHADRKAPERPTVTDADRVALYRTMSFGTGTYKLEGDKAAFTYDTSSNQTWTSTTRVTSLPEISGKTMKVKTAVFKNPVTNVDVFTVTTYERLE